MLSNYKLHIFDCLTHDVFQNILDLAMMHVSPVYLGEPSRDKRGSGFFRSEPPVLFSSTSARDLLFIGTKSDIPVHKHALQSEHQRDWIAIYRTSCRIRSFRKFSFF